MKTIFITGIGTDVGKTVISTILTEGLQADYWKPVQSGVLEGKDSDRVKYGLSNETSIIHPENYLLEAPQSPHFAAEQENIILDINRIHRPLVENNYLIIEGAGGLLVPLNQEKVVADLILPEDYIILVARHYLGSINHSMLSLNYLLSKFSPKKIGVIFNGEEFLSTEQIIKTYYPQVSFIGRVGIMERVDKINIKTSFLSIKLPLLEFLN